MPFQPYQAERSLDDDRLTHAMARNLALWMDVSTRALGVETGWSDTLWWRHPGGSPIYLGAMPLDGDTPDADVAAELALVQTRWGQESYMLYECWATRRLDEYGLQFGWQTPWYVRRPAPAPPLLTPPGVTITRATTPDDLAEFEVATHIGFTDAEDATLPAFSQHAPATLDDPGMCYLLARAEGRTVASVIFYATDDMVGLYGISTIPSLRGRGLGTALVRAGVALYSDYPISVYPDPDSLPIYRGCDFVAAGEIAVWTTQPA